MALLAMMTMQAASVSAQDTKAEYADIASGSATAISPNGKYVVGVGSTYDNEKFSSYLWDTTTKQNVLTTKYNEDDFSKGGMFNYVNNSGVIAGASKSKELYKYTPASDWNDAYTTYFVTATVWKDGVPTYLGIGDQSVDDLEDEYDGSYAVSVSADGNTVAGYIYKTYVPAIACGWKYNATTNKYDYYKYSLPAADALSCIKSMSADGKVAVGYVQYSGCKRPVVWTSAETCKELNLGIDPSESYGGEAAAVSPDGRYALIYVNSGKAPRIAVYDVQTEQIKFVPVTDAYSVKGLTIDNFGNFFCTVMDNENYENKTFYYSAESESLISMDHFMETYAPELTNTKVGNSCTPVALSADGKNLVGNGGSYGAFSSWYLKFDNGETVLNAVENVKVYQSGLNTLTVSWDPIKNLPEGVELNKYSVYVNGENKGNVSAESNKTKFTFDATAGDYKVDVRALCLKGDKEISSDISAGASFTVPGSYAFPMTDDFESQSFATNFWTREVVKGNLNEIIIWNIAGGSAYDFENSSYFANTMSISKEPVQMVLTSRFMDATNVEKPYLSLYGNLTYLNITPTPDELTSDFLDIEYSLDGENWNIVKSVSAKDVTPYTWNFYKVDLNELAGKAFQLRFNVHGEGKAQLRWGIDYVTIGSELSAAPEGVKAIKNGNAVNVSWKNTFGAYEASYLSNSNVIPCFNIGNEGAPLISAVDMPAEKLADYVGQYISSVSSFIYDDQTMGSTLKTQAEAIVYEDGVEVSRQAFDENVADNPYTSTVALSAPVQIKEGKSYRIAVRIHDYDSKQSPLYYQASMESITGTTDLYSEDEGKTWNNINDFNKDDAEGRGMCIWPIRANITETAATVSNPQLDNALVAYNVYRNGVKVNTAAVYAAQPTFADETDDANAKYTVQAFYADGRVSALSEPCSITLSAIDNTFADGSMNVTLSNDQINISGSYDNATLVSANGLTVGRAAKNGFSTIGLAKGVYILTVSNDGKKATYKLNVR